VALASLRPLRHRRFALLFGAGAVSNVGTWMETVAVGSLVYKATGRAAWTTLVAAAAFLPIGVLSPVGGALADRIDRRRFLVAANAFEAGLATLLTVLVAAARAPAARTPASRALAPVVVAVVFLEGCSSALRIPFQESVLPDLVPAEEMLGAVSLGAAQYNAGRVVGPALAAAVIAWGSFAAAFAVNAASFFAVIGAWLAIGHLPHLAPGGANDVSGASAGIWARIRAGARAARAEPGCRAAIGLMAVTAVLVSPFIALVPAKAGLLVGQGARSLPSATGLLTTAQGVGAVLGALVLASLADRVGNRRVVVGALVAAPVAVALFAAAPTVTLAAAALLVVGMTYIGILSGLSAVVQLRAPAAARARVLSLFFVALGVLYPVGAVAQGALADHIGLLSTVGGAAAVMLALVVGVAVARPGTLAALDSRPGAASVGPTAGAVPVGAGEGWSAAAGSGAGTAGGIDRSTA